MASKREAILTALIARVSAIQVANGFATDAGAVVIVGETPELGPDDPTVALAVILGDDQPGYQGEHVFVELPIGIQALARADLEQPWLSIEAVIADIKRAVELEDRTLGGVVRRFLQRGPTRALPREPGSTTVGAVVTYIAPFVEQWGNP